jgi:hypothetical protein
MIKKMKRGAKNGRQGYTLLFAVLVSALVLGVGVSILNIARKELLLNSSARESQYAFYAADTGYECGVYWDSQGAFASSSPATSIKCGTTSSVPTSVASSTVSMTTVVPNTSYIFNFAVPIAGRACAAVAITKTFGTIQLGGGSTTVGISTTLESKGYNVGWNTVGGANDCTGIDATKVERALLVTY